MDLGTDRIAIQHVDVVAQAAHGIGLLNKPLDLMRLDGDVELARGLVLAVDVEPVDRLADRREVLEPEPLEHRHLLGKARHPVGDAVGEEGGQEAAVATARRGGDALAFEQYHRAVGMALDREQGRPQAAQAAADDRQVAVQARRQGRSRRRAVAGVEPKRDRGGVGKRPAVVGGSRPAIPGTMAAPSQRLGTLLRRCICSSQVARASAWPSPPAPSPARPDAATGSAWRC